MTQKTSVDSARPTFSITPDRERTLHGVRVHYITIKERYDHRRYAVERVMFRTFTNALQKYLEKRPDVTFTTKQNFARSLTYLPAGIKSWSAYMPGAFATHSVHNPELKRLVHDQKVDFITRRLFRHSVDAIGLRNRAHILAWLVQQQSSQQADRRVWFSVASGSGQHVYDALRAIDGNRKYEVTISDVDADVLSFAQKIYDADKPRVKRINFKQIDALSNSLSVQLQVAPPTVIDVMGLFEYLDPQDATRLIRRLYAGVVNGGMIVFSNMSPDHPHLDLHQRGLGWPGVKPRTMKEVVEILELAGIPLGQVSVFRSQDKVYGVYAIRKERMA